MTEIARSRLLERVETDLVGPEEETEILPERPRDRYLTGILYCQEERLPDEENEQSPEVADHDPLSGETTREEIGLHHGFRPSSMGLSFAVPDSVTELQVHITGGRYLQRWEDDEGGLTDTRQGPGQERWVRRPVSLERQVRIDTEGFRREGIERLADEEPSPVLELSRQVDRLGPDSRGVTIVLSNLAHREEGPPDSLQFHQASMRITTEEGRFLPRKTEGSTRDSRDARINALLYRNRASYASGHTCSVGWEEEDSECTEVHTAWLPSSTVHLISHRGDRELAELTEAEEFKLFSADWLFRQQNRETLCSELEKLPAAYEEWIDRQREKADSLDSGFLEGQAQENLDRCQKSARRMRDGIGLLRNHDDSLRAFRLAQGVMNLQHREGDLEWRPFQLGFQLQSLASLGDPDHEDRSVMDLLWFPTGGGKTEAYLGLAAYALLHRRLRKPTEAGDGGGVGVLTRYTLRLLTIQQLERSARLICACEALRSGRAGAADLDTSGLGEERFTIGFWAGTSATPNRRARARRQPEEARLLKRCVWCDEMLGTPETGEYRPVCPNPECLFGGTGDPLPVLTVDEDIYESPPSMLIGTIDKFAQLVRKGEAGRLFGAETPHAPPDLIIQDELHLISGPLGTIASLYETAFDALCREQGQAPKVIGSTATIRGASSQVRSLFNRDVTQFPPPAIDAENSFFAVEDRESPGRKYVGLTTAGRSAKYSLQALCASLLQGGKALVEEDSTSREAVDPYWTLLAYFNSLRELGGALSLLEDDVRDTIKALSRRHGDEQRLTDPPTELTSRVESEEIPRILDEMGKGLEETDYPLDAVLATNMISVGMDVPRLGLMVVNGQPKTMAEYIQATSRVGREHPGLIITLFNAMKTRDRSRFEGFPGWHQTLYREVEASSVTPFAPRARDRALRAAIIVLCRHLIDGMRDDPTLTPERRRQAEVLAGRIVDRARDVAQEVAAEVEGELIQILDAWERKGELERYWAVSPSQSDRALVVGAEDHAAAGQDGSRDWTSGLWSVLNSMREVEPGVNFKLAPGGDGR